jgi:hypothetical protein
MKLAKMSLVAAMLIGASAYAVEVTEMSGDARLYYGTNDANDADLFDKAGAYGNAAIAADLGVKLGESVSAKFGMTFLTTMGLENTLVNGIWAGNTLSDQIWIDEANLAINLIDKTTAVVGRQYLDTPLAFSETWNIVSNSFDAAVVVDQHLPETTVVLAWVGRYNGAGGGQVVDNSGDLNLGGNYVDFHAAARGPEFAEGAYAFGAVTSLIPMTTAQVWAYDIVNVAKAYWLQADVDVEGIQGGIQYASVSPDEITFDPAVNPAFEEDSTALGLKLAFSTDAFTVAGAYSTTGEDGALPIANTATNLSASQSKLYTEAWWNYGYVGMPDTDAFMLMAEAPVAGFDLGAYFTSTSADKTDIDMTELTLTAGSSYGAFDYAVAYIYTDADDQNVDANGEADAYNTLQAYLTYNF